MKHSLHRVTLAALLAMGCVVPSVQAQSAAGAPSAAASAPANTLRETLRAPLAEAQKLFEEKNYSAAKEKLQAAAAIADKTPYESYVTARIGLSVALAQDDGPSAGQYTDTIIELNSSGNWLKPQESASLMHAVGIAHYRAKEWGGAARWLERAVQAGATDATVREALISALLLSGNVQKGAELLAQSIEAVAKAGQVPDEKQLQLLYQARTNLKDTAGAGKVLESLVQHYPSKDYWRQLVNRLWTRADLPTRLQLDVFRLALFTNALDEATDFTEYVEFAQRAGYLSEAVAVFDQGVSLGLIGNGDAQKKQRAKLIHDIEQDRKNFTADLAAAQKKPDGFALFNLGMNQVASGQFDKGLELMEKGLAKGLAKYPMDARLRMAVAYAQAKQNEKALQALANVSGPEGIDDLARYWKWALRKS